MSDVSDISNLVLTAQHKPEVIEAPDGRTFIAFPNGEGSYELREITSTNKAEVFAPRILAQHIKLQTTESMIDYINRFKNDDTVLFADINSNTIVSVIDYHIEPGKNPDETVVPPTAKFGAHRATLVLPYSQEWKTWNQFNDKLMSHKDFASFLEEHSIDIVAPKGADLLELCRDLQVISNVNFTSTVRDGDYTNVSFASEKDASSKGDVKLPQEMTISIPVYFGEKKVDVKAFLRRKIDDGALFLGYKLSRVENVRQDEFQTIVGGVQAEVDGLTTVYGTPS